MDEEKMLDLLHDAALGQEAIKTINKLSLFGRMGMYYTLSKMLLLDVSLYHPSVSLVNEVREELSKTLLELEVYIATNKEIVYQAKGEKKIIEEGEYKGVKYAIINHGTYPTAYVENIVGADHFRDEMLDDIEVHCGFSFLGAPYWKNGESNMYLGWDYAHAGDYVGGLEYTEHDKKWTYKEILAEVHSVIDQLLELKEE